MANQLDRWQTRSNLALHNRMNCAITIAYCNDIEKKAKVATARIVVVFQSFPHVPIKCG